MASSRDGSRRHKVRHCAALDAVSACQDETFYLTLAKAIVQGKLRNQRAVLQRFTRNHPQPEIEAVEATLARYIKETQNKTTIAELMGLEGAGATSYFQGFSRMAQPEFAFTKRTRRPPRDPVNALLSFGYTLVGNELTAILSSLGLDPYIGFFHGIKYGRLSLPQDVLEEFRAPVVDRLTCSLINLNILEPEDFEVGENGGLYLKPAALKRYFQEYEKLLNTPFKHHVTGEATSFRRIFALQSSALAQAVTGRIGYKPYWHRMG